jgi:serine/threonine protein kinase
VKLTDFGIARLSWAPLTRSGEVLGIPAYMAPEQISTGDVSPATDIYAVGLVAYEMLTGARPFRGRRHAELLVRVIDAPPASAVMEGVLAKDKDARFTSAAAFVGALRSALALEQSPLDRSARRLAKGVRALFGGR